MKKMHMIDVESDLDDIMFKQKYIGSIALNRDKSKKICYWIIKKNDLKKVMSVSVYKFECVVLELFFI